MAKWETSIVIKRSVEDVFGFVNSPHTNPLWHAGVDEMKKVSDGPINVGTKFLIIKRILGRRLETVTQVTE